MAKLTKIDDARKAGQEAASTMTDDAIRGYFGSAQEARLAYVHERCLDYGRIANGLTAAQSGAYAQGFGQVMVNRFNQLPEVKEENRKLSINSTLDHTIRFADNDLADWKKKLDDGPAHAFEWGEKTAEAAAKRDVALTLKAIVDHPEGGHEAAVAYATEQALRGARWPSHSTSTFSNFMAEAKTAAFAEFASAFGGRK